MFLLYILTILVSQLEICGDGRDGVKTRDLWDGRGCNGEGGGVMDVAQGKERRRERDYGWL